ncbi:MAG: hypothetical protein CSA36_05285 [Draconibacterium sp.]|nr:MAG: hypothetical protein CSA36_05285 [Draconibacterium sp.]
MTFNRKYITIVAASVLIIAAIVAVLLLTRTSGKNEKFYQVKKGSFQAVLDCKGEINGLHAIEIKTPKILCDRDLRLWPLKILDLVQDGKFIKKGDFVMQLDANLIMSRMREEQQELETKTADLNNAKIDSAVNLTQMREDIKNALLDLEYNKIDLEQSVYESEAYQRKAQMTYQKAENEIAKKRRDYRLKQNQLKIRVQRNEEWVKASEERIAKFQEAIRAARITAPKDGIIIFGKSWDGKKYSKDSNVPTYEFAPPIATLPDMSEVISEIYVKEIDIAKIKVGDSVRVTFDALEKTTIMGVIKTIARVGEDHKDFDMKVFKVIINLDHSNPELKPAMSSNNEIILANKDNAISVPLKAVYNDSGEKYVYLIKDGEMVKQPVVTGFENEETIEVKEGLSEGDLVSLQLPYDKQVAANR